MIYLFGLVAASDTETLTCALADDFAERGLQVATLADDLRLVFEAHDGSEVLPRRRAMLRHAKVLECAMASGTVLPMQFGMLATSVDSVAERVAKKTVEVRAAVARLLGRVEVGVRIDADQAAALEATLEMAPDLRGLRDRLAGGARSGHFQLAEFGRALGEHLARRRASEQRRALAALGAHVEASVLKTPEADTQVLRAEFLLPGTEATDLTEAVDDYCRASRFAGDLPLQAKVIGPGPAYNFLNLSLAEPADEAAA